MSWKQLMFGLSGRIGRKQFWIGILYCFLLYGLLGGSILVVISTAENLMILIPVMIIMAFFEGWSALALYAKRLHDHDKSAWWLCMGLIPVFGAIWLIVKLGFLRGTAGANQYGEAVVVPAMAKIENAQVLREEIES